MTKQSDTDKIAELRSLAHRVGLAGYAHSSKEPDQDVEAGEGPADVAASLLALARKVGLKGFASERGEA